MGSFGDAQRRRSQRVGLRCRRDFAYVKAADSTKILVVESAVVEGGFGGLGTFEGLDVSTQDVVCTTVSGLTAAISAYVLCDVGQKEAKEGTVMRTVTAGEPTVLVGTAQVCRRIEAGSGPTIFRSVDG